MAPTLSLVHIGDFHAAPGPRNADRFRAIDQVIAEGLALPSLGAWVWPGDLSHARQAIADRNLLIDRLVQMANRAPVVIVRGNHDLPGDLYGFAAIRATYPVYVIEDAPQCLRFRAATGQNITAACLPYPEKAGLASAGIAPSDVVDTAADALEAIFIGFEAELAAAREAGDLTLFLGHVNVGGAIASTGQPNVGREIELSARHLDRLGDVYKGLNHIHKAQEIHGAHYAGSICRLDWGEIEPKGYIQVDYETLDATDEEIFHDRRPGFLFNVTRQPLDVAPMYHVEGSLTREGFSWQVTAGPGGEIQPAPANWHGCEVRCRYRFQQSEKSILNDAVVLAEFADAARLEVEPIAVPDRALRAPAVVEATTLPEKVAAWATVADVTTSAAVVDKLGVLEHSDPVTLIADVQAWLASVEAGETTEVAA